MKNPLATFPTHGDARVIVSAVLVGVMLLAGVVWYAWQFSPHGVVSATLIKPDGSTRAIALNIADFTWSKYSYATDQRAFVLAAVPSPLADKVAFVTRTKDKVMHVSVADPAGNRAVTIAEGEVGIPSWAPDGTSIAVAKLSTDEADSGVPDTWSVVRAVTHGDSLEVGRGFRPYPSPNQRTFALTSQGISLLSYNDTKPNVVVASPTPVPVTTPFAVSLDGARVAWVAPADKSLQIFENVNGYFVPLLLKPDLSPDSIVFSPDGKYLLTSSHTEATTTLSVVAVSGGSVTRVGDVGGFLKLHTWLYEK
jgi:WD40 repeat protein